MFAPSREAGGAGGGDSGRRAGLRWGLGGGGGRGGRWGAVFGWKGALSSHPSRACAVRIQVDLSPSLSLATASRVLKPHSPQYSPHLHQPVGLRILGSLVPFITQLWNPRSTDLQSSAPGT